MNQKTIGVITRHFISNYGSLLQSFATLRFLDSVGYNSQIINYIPHEEEICNDGKLLMKKNKIRGIKKILYKFFIVPKHVKTAKEFAILRNKYLNCSTQFNEDTISNCKYDIYLSGSDQLWGPIGSKDYDLNYFLDFTDSANKIAYSSSFGYSKFNKNYDLLFQKSLLKFRDITVRESTAVDYLFSLGIPSSLVLDPTFFLSKEEYKKKSDLIKITKKPTVLVYQLHHKSKAQKFAKMAASQMGGNCLSISPNPARNFPFHTTKIVYDPFEFLAYIDGAKYIVTDSFHATVFSIIYNKQFISVNPGNTSTRITSILNLLGLDDRYQENPNLSQLTAPIDYSVVNKNLFALVNCSKQKLIDELEKCK